jgi:adenine-specific DNA-methyltransferase
LAWLKDITEIKGKKIIRRRKMSNLWIANTAGLPKEGGIYFPKSKKPESLIARIIELSTNKSDIVLDSFLGSGTTAAVAHKMGRRWVGIEIGKHAETHCLKRLKGVVKGTDQTGVSKEMNWKGGGGFRFYEVGESVIKDLDMNWDMTLEEMSRAVFMNFDFSFMKGETYRPKGCDDDFHIGKQKGGIAICLVTKGTQIIRRQELNKLIKDLNKKYDNQKITIFTNMGVAVKREELGEQLDVKKIPESILKKYRMV